MNKCLSPILFLLLFPVFLFGNSAEVKGRILNEKNEPVEFASIALLQEKDSSLVFANITDSSGAYTFVTVPNGNYLLAISAVGTSREYYGPLVIDSTSSLITIPDIILTQAKELKEVEIRATKPLFIHKPGMLIMDVEGSAMRSSGTALDVLKKVPGILIDNNNNITFRGKQGVNITIDDKSTFLSDEQLVTYLENMSASEVVRIEIATNPSSKFDAAGRGGHINIVTRKKIQQGMNGNVSLWGGYGLKPKAGGGIELSNGKKKFNFYGNYSFGRRNNLEDLDIIRKISYEDTLTLFEQESDMEELNIAHNAKAGFDYFSDSVTSMGLVLSGRVVDLFSNNYTATFITIDPTDSAFSLQQRNIKNGLDNRASSGLYYKKTLDTSGREFSANADLLIYRNNAEEEFQTHYFDTQQAESGTPYLQRNKTATDITIAVGKIDYVHPFKRSQTKLETGIKSSYVETSNSLHFDVLRSQIWENDTTRSNDFIYKEMIYAAYANGSFKWEEINFQFGLRAEQTVSDGNSPTLNKQIKHEYLQLFPSASLSRSFGKKHNLSSSYSRRIDRPNYENLNPFIFYLDQYTFEKGNPFLKPQFTDAFSLEHSFMDAVFTSVELSRTKDAMTDVLNQVDSTGITYQTKENLNTVDNASFSLSFPIPIGKWFMAENSITEMYSSYRSHDLFGGELNRESWTLFGNSSLKFTLPKDFSIELSAEYQSKLRFGMFDVNAQWQTDIAFSKNFFDKKLSLTCTFKDIFHTAGNVVIIKYQGQDVIVNSYHENRSVWLRMRYNFGQSQQRKSGYKSASDDLQNRTNNK